jgi:hypothetical protein
LKSASREAYKNRRFPLLLRRIAMDNVQSNKVDPPAIEVVEACGEWFVRVVEDGKATTTSFELEAFALDLRRGPANAAGVGKDRADLAFAASA